MLMDQIRLQRELQEQIERRLYKTDAQGNRTPPENALQMAQMVINLASAISKTADSWRKLNDYEVGKAQLMTPDEKGAAAIHYLLSGQCPIARKAEALEKLQALMELKLSVVK